VNGKIKMFTGLIEGIGKVSSINNIGNDMRITVEPLFPMTDECRVGESISIDGVCLTVTDISKEFFSMDVSGETLSRSTLRYLRQGHEVNMERALLLTDRLGGHLVSGHVDGIGKILKKETQKRSWLLRIGIDEKISRYTIEKGSIAVDGISLTINRCAENFFEVNIIPQTGGETTLLKKKVGDQVNIETDLIGKYVEKFFLRDRSPGDRDGGSGIDMEMLIKQGFGD
jgi:riboflavin synthase